MARTAPRQFAILVFLIVPILAACGAGSRDRATITEKREIIRTYPFSDPDPIPILARGESGGRLYPYFTFDGFTDKGEDREWTVVRLENPYVGLSILPEVGGKVRGAFEKPSGREFLYTNHVLKFRQISLRGPWTSGGIEFNFGFIGHSPATATPVDYVLKRNPDGGVSCVVGAMDLPSRTRWSVTITLPKDKAYFETKALWANPSPFNQSYYAWMCAAVKTADDLEYLFPGRFEIGHDYTAPVETWPVDREGRDVSLYRNNNFGGPKSRFVFGTLADDYGGYYRTEDAGFGHWAPYEDVPGRKVWIWDLSRAGGIWVDLLTDKDGQYTEPQAGRLLNQSDHEFFRPMTADRWREIWFPYRGIGPMAKASPDAVLSAAPSPGGLSVGLFALRAIDDDLSVSGPEGKELFRERLKLKTAETWRRVVPMPEGLAGIRVRLGRSLEYNGDPTAEDLRRPLVFKNVDDSTPEGLYMAAVRLEKSRDLGPALTKYLACLDKEPFHVRALARVAELYARRGEYVTALGYAGRALECSMYDPEANYIYGVVSRRQGDLVDAKETFGWAARSMEYRSTAYAQLAEIALLENDPDRAVNYAGKALEANALNLGALEVKATALRGLGKKRPAKDVLERILDIDPLDHLARFELYLLDPGPETLGAFKSAIRWEMPHETYLEAALYYVRLGATADAVTLLRNAPEQPEVLAWLAWLTREKSPGEAGALLDRALSLSPSFVFPFREESIPVFAYAVAARPQDWKAKYYLGLIYWSKGRDEEAGDLFDMCGTPDFAPLYIARATLEKENEPARALGDLERAARAPDGGRRSWQALIDLERTLGKNQIALDHSKEATRLFPDSVPLRVELIKGLMDGGDFAGAAAALDTINALPFEGASEIHDLYVRTHIRLGVHNMSGQNWPAAVESLERSKLYPEKLGTGAPFDSDTRIQDYLEMVCYGKMRDAARAEAARKSIIAYTLGHLSDRSAGAYIGGLVLRESGDRNRARDVLERASPPDKDLNDILRRIQ
jgi:tetratricopeptide (TPR) repeat protein